MWHKKVQEGLRLLFGDTQVAQSPNAAPPVSGSVTPVQPNYASLDYDSSRQSPAPAAAPAISVLPDYGSLDYDSTRQRSSVTSPPAATTVQPLPSTGGDAEPIPVAFFPLTGKCERNIFSSRASPINVLQHLCTYLQPYSTHMLT